MNDELLPRDKTLLPFAHRKSHLVGGQNERLSASPIDCAGMIYLKMALHRKFLSIAVSMAVTCCEGLGDELLRLFCTYALECVLLLSHTKEAITSSSLVAVVGNNFSGHHADEGSVDNAVDCARRFSVGNGTLSSAACGIRFAA